MRRMMQGSDVHVLAAVLVATACTRQPEPPEPAPAGPAVSTAEPARVIDRTHLDAQLTASIESHGRSEVQRFSGFVLVAQHGQPLYARGWGYADRAHKTPIGPDTSFRIGSVTKQFTAAAILALEEQGKLSTRDPIGKHLPEYPSAGAHIAIHQLLTHTAGVPSFTELPGMQGRKNQRFTTRQILELFWNEPLVFASGTAFEYSNSGYAVLGAIIERVSGQPYADFLHEQLFVPAGMLRTVVGDAEDMSDRALGYVRKGDQLVPADPIDMSLPFAAGSVRSTASDLVRWHRALADGHILTQASLRKLYTPERDDYAYGWTVEDSDGHRIAWHDGIIDGFRTAYYHVLDADLAVVVWSNNAAVAPEPIAEAAITAAFGDPVEPVQ